MWWDGHESTRCWDMHGIYPAIRAGYTARAATALWWATVWNWLSRPFSFGGTLFDCSLGWKALEKYRYSGHKTNTFTHTFYCVCWLLTDYCMLVIADVNIQFCWGGHHESHRSAGDMAHDTAALHSACAAEVSSDSRGGPGYIDVFYHVFSTYPKDNVKHCTVVRV